MRFMFVIVKGLRLSTFIKRICDNDDDDDDDDDAYDLMGLRY